MALTLALINLLGEAVQESFTPAPTRAAIEMKT